MPVISSPTRSRYSSNIMSRSASRMRWRITCLAVCAAMRPKSSGVTSRSSIWSRYSSNFAGSISGSWGSTHLARLGVVDRALVDRLDDQVGLEALGDDQLDDDEVAGLAVDLDPRVLGACRAASCRPTAARPRGRPGASRERCPSRGRERSWPPGSRVTCGSTPRPGWNGGCRRRGWRPRRRRSAAIVTSSSEAPTSSPVKDRWPSCSPRVRTRARRPRKRRKCSGLVSGRSVPGEETSSA